MIDQRTGFDSGQPRGNFLLSVASRLPLWHMQPPVQSVVSHVSLFLMSPQPYARVKYAWNHVYCPPYIFMLRCLLKQLDVDLTAKQLCL